MLNHDKKASMSNMSTLSQPNFCISNTSQIASEFQEKAKFISRLDSSISRDLSVRDGSNSRSVITNPKKKSKGQRFEFVKQYKHTPINYEIPKINFFERRQQATSVLKKFSELQQKNQKEATKKQQKEAFKNLDRESKLVIKKAREQDREKKMKAALSQGLLLIRKPKKIKNLVAL